MTDSISEGASVESGDPLRVAYLTNTYPKVSHSFIRREIQALEELGARVTRISIRGTTEPLPDPEDQAEAARTQVLIGGTRANSALVIATVRRMIRSPKRFFRALSACITAAHEGSVGYVRNLAYLAEACRIAEILAAAGVSQVHAHFGTNPAAVAALVKQLTGTAYSLTVHGPDEFDDPVGLRLGEKIEGSAFTVAISSYGRGQLMRWCDVRHWPRIVVTRCGLDRKFLEGAPAADLGGNRFLCVARLSGQKGIPLLLEAAAKVRSSSHSFELRIAGDGELRSVVERSIRHLQLSDCVTLLGWQTADQVRAELEGCRAMVLPSFAEGLPVVIMEALALARPVITTAIAGIPELVDDSCGWVVPSGSVEAVAEAMVAALQAEPATLRAMGERGRKRVLEAHDANTNAAELMNHFQHVRASS